MKHFFFKYFFTLSFAFLFGHICFGSTPSVDLLPNEKNDTNKVISLNKLSRDNNVPVERQIEYATQALELAKKLGYKKGEGSAWNNIGVHYFYIGNYIKAIESLSQALEIRNAIHDSLGLMGTYGNFGNIYASQYNYSKALDYYFNSLHISEMSHFDAGTAKTLNNIGLIYSNENDDSSAYKYYVKALDLQKKLGHKEDMASAYNNIGTVLLKQKKYSEGEKYFNEALSLARESGFKELIVQCLRGLGNTYDYLGEYQKAFENTEAAFTISIQGGYRKEQMKCELDLGTRYRTFKKDLVSAKKYLTEGLDLAKELNSREEIKELWYQLSQCYLDEKDFKNAMEAYRHFSDYKDSVSSTDALIKLARLESKMESDKREREIEEEAKATEEKQKDEIDRQNLYIKLGAVLFVMVCVLVFLVFNRSRLKQRTNDQLQKQNKIIEQKNKDITDSINYAKRIQDSILLTEEEIAKELPQSFILFKPKDVVSGDFYWLVKKENKIFLAAVDCTGHGVPGAFMSIIGNSLLNEIVNEKKIFSPEKILLHLREGVIRALRQSGMEGENKDGMDINLCVFDPTKKELEYAGANNPLWYVRKNEERTFLHELAPDKQPIGVTVDPKPFTLHKLKLLSGDCVYLFTDGYADQFGGPGGKKFKYKQFEELLISVKEKTLSEQKNILNDTLEKWRGNLEQLDDILVMGFRV